VVTVIEECRSTLYTTFMSTPAARARVGGAVTQIMQPERRQPGLKGQFDEPLSAGRSGLPSGSVNSRPLSTQPLPRRALSAS